MRIPFRRIDPVLAGLIVFSLALLPVFLIGPGGAVTSWAVQTCFDVVNMVCAGRLARMTTEDRLARRFWRAVLIATALSGIGDGFQTGLAVLHLSDHRPSAIQTAFVVLGMVVVVVAMLLHPFGGAGRQRLRLWLDAATVVTAVAVCLWYFNLADALAGEPQTELIGSVVTWVVMLLVTVGLLKLVLSGNTTFARGPGIVASVGVAGTALAASTVTLLTGTNDPGVIYVAQLMPCALIPMGLRYQALRMRRTSAPVPTSGRRSSRLPYLAVAAVQILLIVALLDRGSEAKLWGAAAGTAVITALVLSRQIAAFTDNERLFAQIDQSMNEVQRQREWFRSLVQHSSDITLVVGEDGAIRFATPAVQRVLGIQAEQLDGATLSARLHPDDRQTLRELMQRLASQPGTEAGTQARMQHTDGSYRWLQIVAVDLTDNLSVNGVVFNARDVTEARELHDELRYQATHDTLTGLANRNLLQQQLSSQAAANPVSILLIDLDDFKPINDRHGHHAGDRVLTAVAQRLTSLAGAAGLAVRLGGDEFAVLLPQAGPTDAQKHAEQVTQVLSEPIRLAGGQVVMVGASVGVASGPAHDAEALFKDADAAMYRVKSQRKATHSATVLEPTP
ncbi:sensor domain-containing diguanylate cyclase [Actinoplanes sp. TFC3]|uniref:sensor domain-containing diguanylate cyclase n=1 Tax=Actinoplanes sp. TFC3 TaxID=1710355 RepID=UPI00082EA571|nr:sensor domain-containing diguanylate cyclase [Actinoplanes sp. TFC3]